MEKQKNGKLKVKEIFVIALSVVFSFAVIIGAVKVVRIFLDFSNIIHSGGSVYADDETDDETDVSCSESFDNSSSSAESNGLTEITSEEQSQKDDTFVTDVVTEDKTPIDTPAENDNKVDTGGRLYSRTGIKKAGSMPAHAAPYTVIIDPGHGFDDVGCINDLLRGKTEKDITMEMSLLLREELEKRGYKVILIHDGKSFPSVKELTALAEQYNIYYEAKHFVDNNIFSAYERSIYANVIAAQQTVDLYISLHVNSVETEIEKRSGFEIDYCIDNDYSDASEKIFDFIIGNLHDIFPNTKMNIFRDSWADSFIVTKFPIMPSILFEMGFATNKTDADNFFDSEFRSSLIKALADGISEYFA